MHGEYWFDEYGTALFADGDTGEMNHEMYVVDYVVRRLLDHIGVSYNEEYTGTVDNYETAVREALDLDEEVDLRDALKAASETLWLDAEQRDQAVDIAQGCQQPDPRDYAVQFLGWKHANDGNVSTWTFTAADLSAIADGLWDAYDEIHDTEDVYIYVVSTETRYNIPWQVLRDATDPFTLREYAQIA